MHFPPLSRVLIRYIQTEKKFNHRSIIPFAWFSLHSMPTMATFKTKLLKPCKALLRFLKLSHKKRITIPSLKLHKKPKNNNNKKKKKKRSKHTFKSFVPILIPPCARRQKREEMDRLTELKSFNERIQAPCPSPLTPAFIKLIGDRLAEAQGGKEREEAEEACRSFENYLVEMIVEEGKVKDLTDVEELLWCWDTLKCPVFVDLVSRFYGELCKDLFSGTGYNDQYGVTDDSIM